MTEKGCPEAKTPEQIVNFLRGDIKEDLRDFFFARQERILPDQLSHEYAEAREKVKEHIEAIRDKLAPEFYKEILGLENAHGIMESDASDLSYKCGFTDGIRFIIQVLAADY